MKPTYRAIAKRDGRWWFVQVPDEQGLYTQVRRLDKAQSMMREVISLVRDVPEDSFDVVIEPTYESLGPLNDVIQEALSAREAADRAQDRSSSAMRHAVREMRNAGYTSRDAGILLGVSSQRISQVDQADRSSTEAARSKA